MTSDSVWDSKFKLSSVQTYTWLEWKYTWQVKRWFGNVWELWPVVPCWVGWHLRNLHIQSMIFHRQLGRIGAKILRSIQSSFIYELQRPDSRNWNEITGLSMNQVSSSFTDSINHLNCSSSIFIEKTFKSKRQILLTWLSNNIQKK